MKRLNRYAGVLALCAFVVSVIGAGIVGANAAGVFITSKQIKNGTIITQDIHKGGVKSSDVANGTLETQDIGTGEVTPSDVTAPEPEQVAETDTASGPVTGDYAPIMTVDTYEKQDPTSILEVGWVGTAGTGAFEQPSCVFQLRINGAPASGVATGEFFVDRAIVPVSTFVQFTGLPTGPATLEVWAKNLVGGPTATTCIVGPAAANIDQTFSFTELIV